MAVQVLIQESPKIHVLLQTSAPVLWQSGHTNLPKHHTELGLLKTLIYFWGFRACSKKGKK